MSTTSTRLSQEQIHKINQEALAAVDRGHQMLDRAHSQREKLGLTPQKLQQINDALSPGSRAWINTAVSAGLAVATGAGAKDKPRKRTSKSRTMV